MSAPTRQVLLSVSDASSVLKIEAVAKELDIELIVESSPEAALKSSRLAQADCLVVEFSEFGASASSFLDACRKQIPNLPVVALLRNVRPSEAIRFSRSGIFECLDISSTTDQIFSVFESAHTQITELRTAKSAVSSEPWRRHLVGQGPPMDQIVQLIRLIAARRCTVLISGETGTGKEMAARAIHMASDRAQRPMVSVNCSAIPEHLIEAELFGHVKGAFTGAINQRMGRFEQANGGTLFLDEIADLPFDLQAKLLRVLQEREIQRLGSSEIIKTDVRIVAATNANLLTRVQQGHFREDLYYRLNVVPIHMPALRDRASDIALLVHHFVRKICAAENLHIKDVSPEAVRLLSVYSWPGNVRQLENVVEHAVVLSGDARCLHSSAFALPKTLQPERLSSISVPTSHVPDEGLDYAETLRQFERIILQQALSKAQGNKTLAADMLHLPRTTLIHKLRVLEQSAA